MSGIYIHVPFCKKACTYCDFHFSTSLKYADEMTDAICAELIKKKDRINGQVGSIYFGGGTPSVLSSKAFEKIFGTLTQHFSIASDAEITIEANPDDLNAKKIAELRQLPVNRFSIGIQSFFEEDLIWMNRAHNASEAESCIKRSQDAGFENLSIDLIYGYPLLTDNKWLSNIQKAIEFQVPHISAYSLTVEPRTALARAIKTGKQTPVNDEQSAAQFLRLTDKLQEAGFEHYEISNFSKPGKYAVHNTNYWRGVPYLGIGPSAHGFDGQTRYLNIANNAAYLSALQNGDLAESVEELDIYDRFNEYVMTSLRTMWGSSLQKIAADFGKDFLADTLKNSSPFVEKQWLVNHNEHLTLTKEGKLFADHIASELFLIPDDHH
ncbi:oxygen-independent coproporphyrinogen-3 oxidase [Pedobacter africanus]|uniref:Oxygen-independent coproporphyrinogen-3 oxidase n=1 Tax=Pedobacter africanus TaxID=151894 RepID=A0ACC6KXI3_9SPHI|nr:radical SAM family heme chaperone HemW [Pedobacter africanus]MDR6783979.1 oxygen-independent coproporphyrinogen-3 oxidase [Pedobacter africanus]